VFVALYILLGLGLITEQSSSKKQKYEQLFVGFALFSLFASFLCTDQGFSPDSFSLYDMSRSIFTDFGYVSTVRQYIHFSHYGISFPYLLPALINCFDLLTGFSMYSGSFINLFASIILISCLVKISKKLSASAIPGVIIALSLFSGKQYLEELMAGRAVPVALLFVLLALNAVIDAFGKAKESAARTKYVLLAGLFLGAGMVVRFDCMLAAGITGLIMMIISIKKRSIKIVLFYALGLLIFTSPWIIYSLVRFHSPWISDNSGTALMVNVYIPQWFVLPNEEVPNAFNHTDEWLIRLQNSFTSIMGGIFSEVMQARCILPLGIAAWGICFGGKAPSSVSKKDTFMRWLLGSALIIYTLKTLAIIAVGYTDQRYHVETLAVILLLVLCVACRATADKKPWRYFAAVFAVIMVFSSMIPTFSTKLQSKLFNPIIESGYLQQPAYDAALVDIIVEDSGAARPEDVSLFCVDGDATMLGAYCKLSCYNPLINPTRERLLYLSENYIRPNYIYVTTEEWKAVFEENYTLTHIPGGSPIYRVEKKLPAE
jgi:hypothetical protein